MNLEDFFQLGSKMQHLRMNASLVIEGRKTFVKGEAGFIPLIKTIIPLLQKYSLSTISDEEMQESAKNLANKYKDFSSFGVLKKIFSESESYTLTQVDANELLNYTIRWGDRIINELREKLVFPAYMEGNLNPKKLISGAESFFPKKIWQNLQQIEKEDLEDCVKCLLIERWTPAGIMSMRVIESAVRTYYKALTGKVKTNWYSILEDIKKNHPDADKNLIEELDYIRKHIRNPLAHPELRIKQTEAEEAFIHTMKVLTQIYQ